MGFSTIDDPSVVGPVYLKLGNRIRKVESVRKTFGGILHGFEVAYGVVSAGAKARHGDLRLRVPQGAWLTEFDPEVDLGPEAGMNSLIHASVLYSGSVL